ncbi:MAG: SDR family oxidoreductase [Bacteroidales bacterium]|nr:SDR family oxidoreductase [Bacteroidales bacterium]MDY0217630.1 SDR family oxidoreductase [Bacteroidales bacterium]
MRTILITGATSGIGRAIAIKFAEQGNRIVITGRRQNRLDELEKQILGFEKSEVKSLCFDVRHKEAVYEAIDSLPAEWKQIDILINNAGLASGLNSIQEGDIDDWEKMIDTNVKGLLYVTRKIAPLMIDRQKGHIINIGSIAGKEVYPNGNVYCATKHAVDALSKAMRIDMLQHGIKVTQIAPGAAETEFSKVRFHGDEERASKVYQGYQPLMAEDIADTAFFIANLPPHVNINDLLIVPTSQASAYCWNKKE